MKLKSDKKFFHPADHLSSAERMFFGLNVDDFRGLQNIKAKPTGEFRCPKAGEWFLSGAEIEAYKTRHDMSSPYHIAKLVRVETKTIVIETEVAD